MWHNPILTTLVILFATVLVLMLFPGGAANGFPMRFDPGTAQHPAPKSTSWYIVGQTANGASVSCSFVEFDERGDFLDFRQHSDCQARIEKLAKREAVLLVIYCHGWKNNAQSRDVTEFNAFLARLADSDDFRQRGLRVHGIYLGWRGNNFLPYIDKSARNKDYQLTLAVFGEPIVDAAHQRTRQWTGFLPETFSYWNRKGAAESRVCGLPMARAIFTYGSAAKNYGGAVNHRVCVIGHSFGALMLEKSLGQAATGALVKEWWGTLGTDPALVGSPLDLVLFVNSAAPAIYAKEMRDFLAAHRRALYRAEAPAPNVPVIISITSSADWATGIVHPLGNLLAPLAPSLQRRYTSGIFGRRQADGTYPTHPGIRQSEFYTRTPGHQPYLINHWIVKQPSVPLPPDPSAAAILRANLETRVRNPDQFYTSAAKYPAAVWQLTREPQGPPVRLGDLTPAMADSDYWIVRCGKELIAGHTDIWSTTTMELYAGIFRAAESRRASVPEKATPSPRWPNVERDARPSVTVQGTT